MEAQPNFFLQLVQTVGVPLAILAVVGYVFLEMTKKQATELSDTHKWIRETMLTVQKDTSAVVAKCESTMADLLNVLAKREPEYKDHTHG